MTGVQTCALPIFTAVKNDAYHLEETIQSVIANKATTELDLLVIDGGSTDGTVEIIKKYAKHISWWVSEQDNGIYDAMNKGWSAADNNSFILFLGAGDRVISLPDMKNYAATDVVYGLVEMGTNAIFVPRSDFHLRFYNTFHHQALLVNKALHPAPPFDTHFTVYADFDFNQRLLLGGADFVADMSFKTYALPGGVSERTVPAEALRVTQKNFGVGGALLALVVLVGMKFIPGFKKMRPVRQVSHVLKLKGLSCI